MIYPIGDIDDDLEQLIQFYGLSPRACASAGHKRRRALVTIEFFKLDDVEGRKDLFLARARAIVAMYPQLLKLNAPDAPTRATATALVNGFTGAKAEHANCARSFRGIRYEPRRRSFPIRGSRTLHRHELLVGPACGVIIKRESACAPSSHIGDYRL